MKRLPNWERLLGAYFTSARTRPFAWGTFDCAMGLCDGMLAITGVDVGAPYRGRYDSEAGAMALIGSDLGAFAAKVAGASGMAEIKPTFARRGDAGLVNNTLRGQAASTALGQVDLGGNFAWCASDRGFVRVPMKRWLRAWRVG